MSWLSRLFRRSALERDLHKELQFHVDEAADNLVRGGMSREEARRVARVELGGVEQVKEEARDARGTRWIEDTWNDTVYALRAMSRSPGFSTAAILTLAIGIGVNTAVWSILDALTRRHLPVERAEELHALRRTGLPQTRYLMSHPALLQLRAALPDSVPVAGMGSISRLYATIQDEPEGVLVQLVTGNYFQTLGVRAQVGRVVTPADDATLGGGPVAVLSESFWERRFARDPSVVGRSIKLNGIPMTVIGVSQPKFSGLDVGVPVDVFAPVVMQHDISYKSNASSDNADTEQPWVPQEGISWLTLVTRVPPRDSGAVAVRLAQPFRAHIERQLAKSDSVARAYGMRERLTLEPIGRGFSNLRQQFGDPLRVLMASVAMVLLIACANLAGLLLARSAARTHEIAVRVSLGARPGRLVRQALTESLTLAMIGGAVGLVVAHWGTAALLRLASSGTRAIPLDATLDGRVLTFAFGITVIAGLLFGLAPALRVARADLYDSFRTGGRVLGRAGSHRVPLGRMLVAAQIALTLILVTSAGVFVRTFQNLTRIDVGFEREQLVTARIDVRAAGYKYDQLPALHQRLIDAVRGVPGVQSASLSLHGIAANARRSSSFKVPGRELAPGRDVAQENYATPDYFRTVGLRFLSGRGFTDRDTKDSPRVAVINQSAARLLFATDSVVGARFGYDSPKMEVVGVVADARVNSLKEQPPPLIMYPVAQEPQEYVQSLEARVAGDPVNVIAGIRRALATVDKNLPVRDIVVMRDLLERGLTRERMVARLAGGFGLLALLLAAIGLYGVISYSVSRRTNEMGVRLALGASPAAVSWVVLRDSLQTITLGLALGVVLWFPLLRLVRRMAYGLSPHDPATLATGAGLLLVAGMLAGLLPALRAARIDPIEAIRAE